MAARKQQDIDVNKPFTAIKDGSIIKMFEGATSERGPQVLCPHFWELKWANGCSYDCQWCFLNGTYRFMERGKSPHLKPIGITETHIKHALLKIESPTLFNAGELSDGLLFEQEMIDRIMPLFSSEATNPYKHKLMVLTKSKSIRPTGLTSPNNIIIGHSLNAQYVAKRWELLAPHPWDRLEANRAYALSGFETRLRIDPMVPVKAWHVGYTELVERIMDRNPWVSIITIGTLRGLQSTINQCKKYHKDTSWLPFLDEGESTNFGKRPSRETRVAMYGLMKDLLHNRGYKGELAICKETLEVWKEVGLDPTTTTCNCLPKGQLMLQKPVSKKVGGKPNVTEKEIKRDDKGTTTTA